SIVVEGVNRPGAGGLQQKDLVDGVGAPVVEPAAHLFAVAPPAADLAIRCHTGFNVVDPAQHALFQHVANGHEVPIPAAVVEDGEEHAVAVPGGNHRPGLLHGEAHGFVGDGVLAGVYG